MNDITREVIGMSEAEALEECRQRQYKLRVAKEDGKHNMLTMDLRMDRLNIVINNGRVIDAYLG